MVRLIVKQLSSVLAIVIACAIVHAQPVAEELGDSKRPLIPQEEGVYADYSFGGKVDGAKILLSYQHSQSYYDIRENITLTLELPSKTEMKNYTMTQFTVHLEADMGATIQANLSKNGTFDKHGLTLEMVATNSSSARYLINVYGVEI